MTIFDVKTAIRIIDVRYSLGISLPTHFLQVVSLKSCVAVDLLFSACAVVSLLFVEYSTISQIYKQHRDNVLCRATAYRPARYIMRTPWPHMTDPLSSLSTRHIIFERSPSKNTLMTGISLRKKPPKPLNYMERPRHLIML